MKIREFTQDDLDGVKKIVDDNNALNYWKKHHPEGWDVEKVRQEFGIDAEWCHSRVLVEIVRGKIAGVVAGHALVSLLEEIPHIVSHFVRPEGIYYVRNILCDPTLYRSGVGNRLMREISAVSKQFGYDELVTRTLPDNNLGRQFFLNNGFQYSFDDSQPSRSYFGKSI